MYDTLIIGGGPAGAAAAVYAARKKIKTIIITKGFGGQSEVSDSIENWIGEKKITGSEFAKMLEEHVRAQEDIDVKKGEEVKDVKELEKGFEVITNKEKYRAKTIIVCSGGRRRKLKVPGAEKFEGKGISYCATCDAPLFRDKSVAVVGGGNAGLEAVIDLKPYAKKIYLLNLKEKPTGDPVTLKDVKKIDKSTIINNADTQKIIGDKMVSGLEYKDLKNDKTEKLDIQGVFVEIGSVPNSGIVKNIVKTNDHGEIIADDKTQKTSKEGIYAAGDVTDEIYKQNNIAAGDAVKAALACYNYLLNIKRKSPAAESN